ncbi:hypothetical protein WJX74_005911 [Apatococcus lobatus]|uniref:Uncharacterized protein n=1 Tax=Apatococcus lobatus TaxID=904363 RepID=A0AAW1R3X7_9CHLO
MLFLGAQAASREQQMAELNGNLPMLSSLAQSGSTRAGSDLARAFYSSHAKAIGTDADPGIIGSVITSSHDNGLPVITSSRDVLPTVFTEPNKAGYSIASALASDLPGLQERARISELAQESRIGKAGMQGPNEPAQHGRATSFDGGSSRQGNFPQRYSDQGKSAAAAVSNGNTIPPHQAGTADDVEDGPDKAMAAVHWTVPSGPAKMPRWPVMPKLASSDHFGAPRRMFETGASKEEGLRAQLQAASVAGLAGAATRRLLQPTAS